MRQDVFKKMLEPENPFLLGKSKERTYQMKSWFGEGDDCPVSIRLTRENSFSYSSRVVYY